MLPICDSLDRQYRPTLPALFASRFILPYLRSTFRAYCKPRVCRIWTKRYRNSCKSLFLVEMRTAANAFNWKLNGTTSSMSCLTGVRTIRLFLRLLQLPQNGPYRGSLGTENPTVEVIPCCYKSQKSPSLCLFQMQGRKGEPVP